MKNMKEKTTNELIENLYKISELLNELREKEDVIITELCDRMPVTEVKELFHPKVKLKELA